MEVNGADYTVKQLREWLRVLNLPMGGKKSDLVLRINNVPIDERGECPVADEEEYDSATENVVNNDDHNAAENITRSNSALLESLEQIQAELVRMQKLYENAALENVALKKKINEKELRVPDRELTAPYTLLKEIMVEFDGNSDVTVWAKQFKNVEKAYNADVNTMRALLVSKLKGKAQQWLVQLSDYAAKSPDEILEALVDNFKCMTSSKLQQRQAFENRKWRADETFALYCADKTNLAKNLNMLEDELVEYIVDGIPDPRLRDHANISCLTTTAQLLRAFGKVSLKPLIRKPDPKDADVRCFNCMSGYS